MQTAPALRNLSCTELPHADTCRSSGKEPMRRSPSACTGLPALRKQRERRWQVQGRRNLEWHVFEDSACKRLESAHVKGEQSCAVWTKGLLHEVDFRSMRALNGRGSGAVRRLCTKDLASASELDCVQQSLSSRPTAASREGNDACLHLGKAMDSHRTSRSSGTGGDASAQVSCVTESRRASKDCFNDTPVDMVGFAHPGLADMEEPRFQIEDEALCDFGCGPPRACTAVRRSAKALCVDAILDLVATYSQLLRLSDPVLPTVGPATQVMAALSLALFSCRASEHPSGVTFKIGEDSVTARSRAHALRNEWRQWRQAHGSLADELSTVWTPSQSDGFLWLRDNMSSESRFERLKCACSTLRYAAACKGSEKVVSGTRLSEWVYRGRNIPSMPQITSKMRSTAVDEALARVREGHKVAVAIPASPQRIGGNFLSGGPHGQEEEFCVRSNLYLSLQEAERQAIAKNLCDAEGHCIHIPENGVVVSPGIKVFRKGPSMGYAALLAPVKLTAVISFSIPCPPTPLQRWRVRLEQTFEMALREATKVGADVLVLSLTCGKDLHQAWMAREALDVALLAAHHQVKEIILTG